MAELLRDLLTAEDHAQPYVWAAVALAHAMIGVALMIFAGLIAAALLGDAWAGLALVAAGYALWEIVQTVNGGGMVDAAVDWTFVMLGAVIAWATLQRWLSIAGLAVLALAFFTFDGVSRRVKRGR